jgi:microcystin-dependent protein
MSQPFIGEIRMFSGSFAPAGWAFCDGQLLPISENETLFNLIGTTYGGDGQETFALPNLQSRIPLHQGGGFTLAETGGAESITLTVNQIPSHTHAAGVSSKYGSTNSPDGTVVARSSLNQFTDAVGTTGNMGNASTLGPAGGSQPHSNLQPYLVVNYIISLFGIFPSQSGGGGVTDPHISQISWVAFNFAPSGWALCNGQLLPINQNQALFALLGTTYGGDGRVNFALPNLQARVPIHTGSGHTLGEMGGEQAHTLSLGELPGHTHAMTASGNPAGSKSPLQNTLAVTAASSYAFVPDAQSSSVTAPVGGSQAHLNMQPFLTLNAIIALQGIFPSQN